VSGHRGPLQRWWTAVAPGAGPAAGNGKRSLMAADADWKWKTETEPGRRRLQLRLGRGRHLDQIKLQRRTETSSFSFSTVGTPGRQQGRAPHRLSIPASPGGVDKRKFTITVHSSTGTGTPPRRTVEIHDCGLANPGHRRRQTVGWRYYHQYPFDVGTHPIFAYTRGTTLDGKVRSCRNQAS